MIVAICGRSGVGKSSICQILAGNGFRVISASDVAREMFRSASGRNPTTLELASFGVTILESDLEGIFASRIVDIIDPSRDTLVDGLRSNLAIRRLRDEFGAITVLITRQLSSSETDTRGGDASHLRLAEQVNSVDSKLGLSKGSADIHIVNDASISDATERLLSALQSWAKALDSGSRSSGR